MNQQVSQSQLVNRLGSADLRKRLAKLGLEVSFYQPPDAHVQGLTPKGLFCQRLSETHRHCQGFLDKLAREVTGNPSIRCKSCIPGAFTVAARLKESDSNGPLVLGCFLTKSLGASEELLRMASQLQLDHTLLLSSISAEVCHRPEDVELLAEVLANIAQDWYARSEQADEVESLSRNLAETYEELSFIYKLNNAMNVTAKPQEYFRNLAEDLCELLAVKAVLVVIFPEVLKTGEKEKTYISSGGLPQSAQQIIDGIYPKVLAESGSLVYRDPTRCPTYSASDSQLGRMLLAPVLRGERQLGMLIALEPLNGRAFDNIDATRLGSVANSAAVFLENFRLYGSMGQLFLGSLRALTSSIDAKDPYTCGHSERVASMSKKLVEAMGLAPSEADRVYLCGLLHDIGKIGVPEAVLGKPGRLTDDEFELIKQHPATGAKIIGGIQEMEDLIPGVLHHHERMDGKGYPQGLPGEQIPFRARVLCVADCLDAMTSDRPYRKALSVETARTEILRNAGTQFDPDLAKVFLQLDLSEQIAQLREHKGQYVPDNIYEPSVCPAGEVTKT